VPRACLLGWTLFALAPGCAVVAFDGGEPVVTAPTGTQATGTQAAGTQAAGTQAAGTQAAGTQAAGTVADPGTLADPGALETRGETGLAPPAKRAEDPIEPIFPPALVDGATIGLVAPASSIDETSVRRAVDELQRRGYHVKLSLGYRQRKAYLAADDAVRAAELNAFFADPDVDAILCLRGGYGSPRILDRVDYEVIRARPKILIGYSDITALLNAVERRTGLVVFHGPMAKELGDGLSRYSDTYFWPALRGASPLFEDWGGGGPGGRESLTVVAGGACEGRLVGGNLSVLVATIGTPYEFDSHGTILFLEEVNEKAFRIDRMLNQLRLGGQLASTRGVILGSFSGCGNDLAETSERLDDLFAEYFAGLGVPVLSGFPIGHTRDQVVLPIGVRARLDADARKLTILETPTREASRE